MTTPTLIFKGGKNPYRMMGWGKPSVEIYTETNDSQILKQNLQQIRLVKK